MRGGFVAFVCTVAALFLGWRAVVEFPGWGHASTSVGIAVVVIGLLFGLWWLFGESTPTGLQRARQTVSRLEAEEASRNRTLGIAGVLFAATVVLLVAMLLVAN